MVSFMQRGPGHAGNEYLGFKGWAAGPFLIVIQVPPPPPPSRHETQYCPTSTNSNVQNVHPNKDYYQIDERWYFD